MHRQEVVANARGGTRCSVTRAALSRAITARTPQARSRIPRSVDGADTPDARRPKRRLAYGSTNVNEPTDEVGLRRC